MVDWLLSLTDHQLNVLSTVFGVLASVATVFSIVAANFARLARRDAKRAVANTQREERIDGDLHTVSVSQDTHRATHETHELRGEIVQLVAKPVHGRRRNTPTNPVRTSSQYEGLNND